jgi:hypothetical protein
MGWLTRGPPPAGSAERRLIGRGSCLTQSVQAFMPRVGSRLDANGTRPDASLQAARTEATDRDDCDAHAATARCVGEKSAGACRFAVSRNARTKASA